MRLAFAAAGIVALVAGPVGYLLVLRGQTFAGHALSHVGFTGATGAVLLGLPPLWGLAVATLAAGASMGWLGAGLVQRDVAIGMVLAAALGLGLLFLHYFTASATQVTALLFGNVLGVDHGVLLSLAVLGATSLIGLLLIGRTLLFASLLPEVAEARGVNVRLVDTAFLSVVALSTAACTPVVGVLLVFTLLVGPAATAQRLTSCLAPGLALATGLALAEAWGGIALAWVTDWPTSVGITLLSAGAYAAACVVRGTHVSPLGRWLAGGDARR